MESVLNLCLEPDERSSRIFPSFRLSKLKIDLDDDETRTTLNIDTPTLTSLAVVSVQLVSRLAQIKSFASNGDLFRSMWRVIDQIPFDDELKVRSFTI